MIFFPASLSFEFGMLSGDWDCLQIMDVVMSSLRKIAVL